jgi:hypothetical protein
MSSDHRSPVDAGIDRIAAQAVETASRLRDSAERWQEQPFPPDLVEMQRVILATAAMSDALARIARALERQVEADDMVATSAEEELLGNLRVELASARTDLQRATDRLARVVVMNAERRLGLDTVG